MSFQTSLILPCLPCFKCFWTHCHVFLATQACFAFRKKAIAALIAAQTWLHYRGAVLWGLPAMADVDSISAGGNPTPQPMEVECLETGKICSFCFFFGNIISNAGIFPLPEIKCFRFLKPSPIYESILQLCSWGTASLCCHLQDELEMIVIVADSWGLATPHPCQPAVKSCGMCPGLDSSIDQWIRKPRELFAPAIHNKRGQAGMVELRWANSFRKLTGQKIIVPWCTWRWRKSTIGRRPSEFFILLVTKPGRAYHVIWAGVE